MRAWKRALIQDTRRGRSAWTRVNSSECARAQAAFQSARPRYWESSCRWISRSTSTKKSGSMAIPPRAKASIRLDMSRPVLMTHLAPRRCRPPMISCNSAGIGGVSNSANRGASKSVEMSLWGKRLRFAFCGFRKSARPRCADGSSRGETEHAIRNKPPRRLRKAMIVSYAWMSKSECMSSQQEQYDDAMFDFSRGDYDGAIVKLTALLAQDAAHFEAQLALGMAYYRKGDYAAAIVAGHAVSLT